MSCSEIPEIDLRLWQDSFEDEALLTANFAKITLEIKEDFCAMFVKKLVKLVLTYCRTQGQFGVLSYHFRSKRSAEYNYLKKNKRGEETSRRSRHLGNLHIHRNAAIATHPIDILSSGFTQDFRHFAAEGRETIAALKHQINKLEARLWQEGCMDDAGIPRKENEHWMKEDCISSSCENGQIICTVETCLPVECLTHTTLEGKCYSDCIDNENPMESPLELKQDSSEKELPFGSTK